MPDVSVAKPCLLLLDDEVEILNSLKRLFRRDFDVFCFECGDEALAAMDQHEFAIIVSDMRMPKMDGATFLTQAKQKQPHAIRLLLTGYADMESTVKAVNDGGIMSYISKPWNNEELKLQINAALNQYQLEKENRELAAQLSAANAELQEHNRKLEQVVKQRTEALRSNNDKLKNSAQKYRQIFLHVLQMVNLIVEKNVGKQQGHYQRVAMQSRLFAEKLGLSESQCVQLYLAGLIHDVGQIGLPEALKAVSVADMSLTERERFMRHSIEGAKILATVPGLKPIADVVLHQFESVNGEGFPEQLSRDEISIEARILRIVKDYDNLMLGQLLETTASAEQAQTYLKAHAGEIYDPKLVREFIDFVKTLPDMEEQIAESVVMTTHARPGMTLSKDLVLPNGGLMLTTGTELTRDIIDKLKSYEVEQDCFLTIYIG
jgi:response regulator RpfG family c-di-GMP phosphodiesterase